MPVRHKSLFYQGQEPELMDKLTNSFGYLATGNLIVNITRMGRDDFEVSYILKSKHCVR